MSCQSKRSKRGHSLLTPSAKTVMRFLEKGLSVKKLINKLIVGRVEGHRRGNEQQIRVSVLNPGVIGIKVYGNHSIQELCVVLDDVAFEQDFFVALEKALEEDFNMLFR